MEWKIIPKYPMYSVSEYGDVKNNLTNKILKQKINRYGYSVIGLFQDRKRSYPTAHRLVAATFIPNPENKPQVNHIDGNKLNNHVSNLEWCTSFENMRHSIDNKLLDAGIEIDVKDLNNNSVKRYSSIKLFSKEISLASGIIIRTIKYSSIFPILGRYKVKVINPETAFTRHSSLFTGQKV